MDDISIDDLIVTQRGIREASLLKEMVKHVEKGGYYTFDVLKNWVENNKPNFSRSTPLIQISRFPDGLLYIHDGHHRVLSMMLAGRKYISKEEYNLKDWEYEEYLEVNFSNNWLTPFDPRVEVRFSEFFNFKNRVWGIYNNQSPQHAYHLIKTKSELYKTKREVYHIRDILNEIQHNSSSIWHRNNT